MRALLSALAAPVIDLLAQLTDDYQRRREPVPPAEPRLSLTGGSDGS